MIINPYALGAPAPPPSVTWDPGHVDSLVSLSNGNLTATRTGSGDSGYSAGIATVGRSTGRRMYEIVADSATYGPSMLNGIANASQPLSSYVGSDLNGWSWNGNSGLYYHDASQPGTSPSFGYGSGDVLGFYIDLDTGDLWISKNGVGNNGTVGSTGSRDYSGIPAGAMFPAFSFTRNSSPAHQVTLHALSADVVYPVAGFTPWGDP